MPSKRLILSTSPFETRAAILEDGSVAEVLVERTRSRGVAGNIYKGRVRKVLKGMQSAFVDIGLDKDAFLYVDDVVEAPSPEESWDHPTDCEPSDAALVPPRPAATVPIESVLTEGQSVIVQVAKEPLASKGARVTAHVTLPGRYLVYMPTVNHVGVSRRIESEVERQRLKEIVSALREQLRAGFIVRTAAEGRSDEECVRDAEALHAGWRELNSRAQQAEAPALLHAELGLVDKLMRDVVTSEFEEILTDDERDRARCEEYLSRSGLDVRLERHRGSPGLFEVHGIESEIEKALRSKVWLKSGGYIVINQTEALVSIDVNTGRYVGRVTLEDTVLRTNLEAVAEVVRQIRLRDLGGIIVVDFIDMEERANRERLLVELEQELRRDRSKSKILQLSDFGLVEMTRKRVRSSLERLLTEPCSSCAGSGRVKSAETVCYEIHRELMARTAEGGAAARVLRVHPSVASWLRRGSPSVLDAIEREAGEIRIIEEPGLAPQRFELLSE